MSRFTKNALRFLLLVTLLAMLPVTTLTGRAAGQRGDGDVQRFAILIHGWGEESYWWDHMMEIYNMLVDVYGYTDNQIFFYYRWGLDDEQVINQPDAERERLDGAATMANIESAITEIARQADADDEVLVWMPGHGAGYNGADVQNPQEYAHLSAFTYVDANGEPDYLESDFSLEALYTGGVFGGGHHGMNEWKLVYTQDDTDSNLTRVYRHKFVSRFTRTQFTYNGYQSDTDNRIEELVDYHTFDANLDGVVDLSGQSDLNGDGIPDLPDSDGDGVLYYDPETGLFDEDEWGQMDTFVDNVRLITFAPTLLVNYVIFDDQFDSRLDIDLNYIAGNPLHADGTDQDGHGLFDGLDVNGDGRKDSWITIHEDFIIGTNRLTDQALDNLLDRLDVRAITVIIASCYSGGFITELSAPGRTIIANTGEEVFGYGINFSDQLLRAFSSEASIADINQDGRVSLVEAFNHATVTDPTWCGPLSDPPNPDDPPNCEEPLYDDNGDRQGSIFENLPASDTEGIFGESVFIGETPSSSSQP